MTDPTARPNDRSSLEPLVIEPAALKRAHWSRRMMNDGLRSIIGLGSPRLITSPAGHQARARWTITGPAGAVV